MSARSDIIDAFKSDIEEKLTPGRGYNTSIMEVILGIVNFDDFSARPALGYWAFSDEKDQEFMDDNRYRILNIVIYGYTDTDGLSGYESIYNFADDVEKFLMSSDWTYTCQTMLGEIVITVGGSDNQRCMFDLTIQVSYIQDWN